MGRVNVGVWARHGRVMAIVTVVVATLLTAVPSASSIGRGTERIAGNDRFETAARIAERSFPARAGVVYLARSDVFADALAAGVLSDGPVLLVPGCGEVPVAVHEQITRLDPDVVLALGGTAAVCDRVLTDAAAGRAIGRVAGADRFETAAEVSRRRFPGTASEVYLASGADSPDAVSGGSLTRGPILLVPPDGSAPQVVRDELARLAPRRVVVLGGPAAVSDAVVADAAGTLPTTRLAGADRFETSARIAGHQFGAASAVGAPATTVYLARGDVFADAVASGSLADGPVLLVPSCGDVPAAVASEVRRLQPSTIHALGGPGAICDPVVDAVAALPGLDVLVPDTTVVLGPVAREALKSDVGGVLTFAVAGAPAVGAGDVIVSHEVPGVAPQGLLRRVRSVARDGTDVRVTTEFASITDAVHEGGLELQVPLTRADLVDESGPAAARRPAAATSLVSIDEEREFVLHPNVTATGTFTYDASLDVSLDVDVFPAPTVESFVTALTFDESVGLTIVADGAASWSSDPITLWEGEFRCFWTAIGPLPISLCPYLTIELTGEGEVEGTVTMGASQSANIRFGAEYSEAGGWRPINEYADDHSFAPPSLQVDAAARANVRGQLGIEVYDLAGPYVFADVYVRGEAEVVDTLACWGLYAGLEGGFGVEVDDDLLGDLELPELDLLRFERLLAEDPVPHHPCEEVDREGDSWFGTVDFAIDYRNDYDGGPGMYSWNEEHHRGTLQLTGELLDFRTAVARLTAIDASWHSRSDNDGDHDCWSEVVMESTGNIPDPLTYVDIYPSASAPTPEFLGLGATFEVVWTDSYTCDPPGSTTHGPEEGGLGTLFGADMPDVTVVPGGRRICDVVVTTHSDADATTSWTQTVTTTYRLAEGAASPDDCP